MKMRRGHRTIAVAVITVACWICTQVVSAATLRVDSTSTAITPDGSSWALSFPFLQDALTAAGPGDVIIVAQGRYFPDDGAGLLLERESFSLIEDCVFFDNEVSEGGGMTVRNSSNAQIDRCRFENNVATDFGGGGFAMKLFSAASFTDCVFKNNTMVGGNPNGGGGLLICDQSDATLGGCLFQGNLANPQPGGAAFTDDTSSLTVVDCAFADNERMV